MYRSYEKLDKSEETKGLVYMYSLTFTRKKKQQTTNLARIWHCYLCPSPRPPSTLRSPTFRPFIGYREGLGRGGWLVYTAYDITFKIRTRTH